MTTAHLIVRSSCLLSLLLPCTFHNAFSGESSCETTTDCPEDSVCSVQNQCVPRLRPGVGRQATVGVAISSAQKDFDYAQAAHKRGDYALALTTYRILSDRNYAPAQNNIGIMYLRGQGVPIDDRVALEFFRRIISFNSAILA